MNFEEIYEQYFSYIYKYILKLSGSRDIADEITSETFLKALKSIDKFKGELLLRGAALSSHIIRLTLAESGLLLAGSRDIITPPPHQLQEYYFLSAVL